MVVIPYDIENINKEIETVRNEPNRTTGLKIIITELKNSLQELNSRFIQQAAEMVIELERDYAIEGTQREKYKWLGIHRNVGNH